MIFILNILHSEWSTLCGVLAVLSATGIGPVKQIFLALNFDYFLIHLFKPVFWVL